MTIERAKADLLMLLMVFWAVSAWAQDVDEPPKSVNANAIRVIRDPHTTVLWRLERDPTRPGGPGRMVLQSPNEGSQHESGNAVREIYMKAKHIVPAPAIRSGERLIVEENSALVEARLEAVALGSAIEGAELRVRLAIGGKIVKVVAIGHGRATLTADAGQP